MESLSLQKVQGTELIMREASKTFRHAALFKWFFILVKGN